MTTRITVKNEVGRPINPHQHPAIYTGLVSGLSMNEFVYNEFEQSVKSYPCPGIPDTKEGESVECELVYQYLVEGRTDVWVTDSNQHVAAHHDAIKCGLKTRQIYRLLQQPKEESEIKKKFEFIIHASLFEMVPESYTKEEVLFLMQEAYDLDHQQPKEQEKEKTAEEKAMEALFKGVQVYETNIALGYNELAYFIHYREMDYLCISIKANQEIKVFQVGKLSNFAKHEVQHLEVSKYKIEDSTLWNSDVFACVIRAFISSQSTRISELEARVKELEGVINNQQSYIEKRIKELYEADAKFCQDRWDMSKHEFVRKLARESSNSVTLARQELQQIPPLTPLK